MYRRATARRSRSSCALPVENQYPPQHMRQFGNLVSSAPIAVRMSSRPTHLLCRPSNYVFKPPAEEVARIIRTTSRGGGLTRH